MLNTAQFSITDRVWVILIIKASRAEPCGTCGGSGQMARNPSGRCGVCFGTGSIRTLVTQEWACQEGFISQVDTTVDSDCTTVRYGIDTIFGDRLNGVDPAWVFARQEDGYDCVSKQTNKGKEPPPCLSEPS